MKKFIMDQKLQIDESIKESRRRKHFEDKVQGQAKQIADLEYNKKHNVEYISRTTFYVILGIAVTVFLAAIAGAYQLGIDRGQTKYDKEKIELDKAKDHLQTQVDDLVRQSAESQLQIGKDSRLIFLQDSTIKVLNKE